jgi:hypothetical protein
VLTGAPCYASSSSSVGSTSSSARRSCRTSPDLSHASRASPKRGPRGPANRGLLPYSPPARIETDRDEADAGVGDAGSVEFRKLVPSSDDETDRDASRKTPSQHIRFPCTSATSARNDYASSMPCSLGPTSGPRVGAPTCSSMSLADSAAVSVNRPVCLATLPPSECNCSRPHHLSLPLV